MPATQTKRWAGGYDSLPDPVNEAILRVSELYHHDDDYSPEHRGRMSRVIAMHVNELLRKTAEQLDQWLAELQTLISEVEQVAHRRHG